MDFGLMSGLAPALSAVSTLFGAVMQHSSMQAQADAQAKQAAAQQEWANRRALEERASAQRTAADEQRKAVLAQSRLGAVAGASGSGGSDKTVMDLFAGIQREGDYNAGLATAAGEQKAAGITYQAALDRWSADADASIKRASATGTLIGGILNAGAGLTKMSARYPSYGGSGYRTGYA